jgi:SDR family mycofactocin-dependent oxidoreductase
MGRLDGKVALVTGAARGQGRAHAVRLAQEGADIIACDVCAPVATTLYKPATAEELAETVRAVEAEDRRILARQADIRDLPALEALVADGVGEFGRLDIVVANAGAMNAGRLWEITPEQWNTIIEVNLTGTWNTIKASVPAVIAGGRGGSIILISSSTGLKAFPFLGAYGASKFGVTGLGQTLANELGEYNIRVNTVHPAGVQTEIINDTDLFKLIGDHQHTLAPVFMTSLATKWMAPEDISNAVAFLASDDSRYMTGSKFVVDLGTVCR